MSSGVVAAHETNLRRAMSWLADSPGNQFRLVLFGLYAMYVVTGLVAHAMWRDEVQAWLLVRDSSSLAELAAHLAYEGHPLGWYLVLWPLKAFGTYPELAQVAQGACVLATAALLLWRGPFGRLELTLLLLSYPFFFEYAVKTRSYVLGCLLLFLFCAAFSSRRRDIVLAALVALLWNVHVLFGLTAMGCIAAHFARRVQENGVRQLFRPADALPMAVILLGILGAVLVAMPPRDSGYALGWRFDLESSHVNATVDAFSELVFGPASSNWMTVSAGFAIIVIALMHWRRAPAAAACLAVAVCSIVFFMHAKYGSAPWHRAVLFVTLIASIWIARGEAGPRGPSLLPRWLLALLLATQAIAGVRAAVSDRVVPYSGGRGAAVALRAAGLEQAPIFALRDAQSAPVLAYLGSSAFFAHGMRQGSYTIWDQKRLEPFDLHAVIDRAAAREGAIVLDCADQMPDGPPPDPRLREWGRFPGATENCVVYRFAT